MRILFVLMLSLAAAAAEQPVLLATMGSKASVSFGGKPVTIGVGETRQGVKLLSVAMDSAVFEAEGKRSTVQLGQGFFAAGDGGGKNAAASTNTVTLFDAGRGHFIAQISSHGNAVRGLIDTGATFLSVSGNDAQVLGIKPDRGSPVRLSTAQGFKTSYRARVDEIKLEGITLYNVDAVVTDGNFPEMPLIGMSVLNQMNMQRDGDHMTLKKKF